MESGRAPPFKKIKKLQQIIYYCVNIAAIACIKKNFFNFISINTEKISYKLIYLIKNSDPLKMDSNKNLNDLLINLKPKVIRFTGEKFPTELWNSCQIKKNKKIST